MSRPRIHHHAGHQARQMQHTFCTQRDEADPWLKNRAETETRGLLTRQRRAANCRWKSHCRSANLTARDLRAERRMLSPTPALWSGLIGVRPGMATGAAGAAAAVAPGQCARGATAASRPASCAPAAVPSDAWRCAGAEAAEAAGKAHCTFSNVQHCTDGSLGWLHNPKCCTLRECKAKQRTTVRMYVWLTRSKVNITLLLAA